MNDFPTEATYNEAAAEIEELNPITEAHPAQAGEEPPLVVHQVNLPAEPAQDWKEQYVRLMADFENYKRRTQREMDDRLRYANEGLLKALVSVLDEVQRGLTAAATSDNLDSIRQGLTLIGRNFAQALQKQGVEEIKALGQPFDSTYHEAIAGMPAANPEQKGQVLEEVEKGFTFHGKVIRYAKVITAE